MAPSKRKSERAPMTRPAKAAPMSEPCAAWVFCVGEWGCVSAMACFARVLSLGDADAVHDVVLLNLLHHVDTLDDLAEDRVDAVQVPAVCVVEHDEELAATGVFAGVGHGERADLVRARIAGRLALDLVARTAGADTRITGRKISRIRVAALNDEVGHDAVELHDVIEAAVGEL